MGSRPKTGGDRGRLPAITRRSILAATLATPTPAQGTPQPPSDVLTHARTWLAIDAEIDRLMLRWQAEESRLARDFDWLRLPEPDRRSHPEARELYEIDVRIEALSAQQRSLLDRLERLPATSMNEVAAKLSVAAAIMRDADAPGFELFAEALRELAGRIGVRCP